MKRSAILFLLILFITIASITFLISRRQSSSTPAIIPPSSVPTVTAPRKFPISDQNITFTYTGSTVSFPSLLPIYSVSFSDLTQKAKDFASFLKISVPLTQPVAYMYEWIGPDKILTYNDDSKTITYTFSVQENSKVPPFNSDTMFSYLKQFSFLSDQFSEIEASRVSNISEQGEGSDNNPPSYVVSYSSFLSGLPYPVIFSPLSSYGVVVVNDSEGVLSFSFPAQPTLTNSGNKPLISLSNAIQELNNGKGYLTELGSSSSSNYGQGPTPDFSEVNLDTVSLAYLYDSDSDSVVPIFIFDGFGMGQTNQKVRYYLRATN